MKRIVVVAVFFVSFLAIVPTSADEGMWLLSNLPLKQLSDKYNFIPTPHWIGQVQKSSARLPNCSASFVSGDGLLMTNWHCSEEAVKALSASQNNYYENGFYARTLSEELKTNLNIRVLMTMDDVTEQVNHLTTRDTNGDAATARQNAIKEIQKNFSDMRAMVCEVVILYQGGQYHNYCYKVYNDVRLVFVPEQRIGFLGGDADNFEYPRYTLDVSFLRAYENGKPAKTPDHFKWSKFGAQEGELIFVAGHPGRTVRLLASSALKTERDVRVPFLLDLFRRRELTTRQFMLLGKKEKMIADLEFVEGLLLIKDAQIVIRKIYPEWLLLARGFGFDSEIFSKGKVRINLEYEEHKLTDSLTHLVEVLGADNQVISAMMKDFGNGPAAIARNLVNDPAAKDKFLEFIKPESRFFEQEMLKVVEKERRGYAKIENALLKMYGADRYPDATFTLRLSFGTVAGDRQHGILPFTTIGGAYRHSAKFGNSGDYKLPSRWWVRKNLVNQKIRLNFISDLDITGGNSGSPVFNRNREIVGIVFDSNIHGLVSDYDFSYSPQARAVAVHSAGIIETLKNIYQADRLVKELTRP